MRIWVYEANVVRNIDGDTTVVDVNQGLNVWSLNQGIRYAGINAPEVHGESKPEGDAAAAYLDTLVPVGANIWLATVDYHEREKFGRILAVVYTAPPTHINMADAHLADMLPGSVNQEMLDSGHAVPYNPSNM